MHNLNIAPIVLLVYNRPKHTKLSLDSLVKNNLANESILYVFADGPKENASDEELQKIIETRSLFKNINGFKEVILIEKEKNEGLANSVIKGVTEVVNKYGKVIVLEDDLLLSKYFLEFMNEGLNIYENASNIYSINGFMFPIKHSKKETVALTITSTWGWATWSSKWQYFSVEMTGKEYLIHNSYLSSRFNIGEYKYTEMLYFKDNSWGIKWYFSVFIRNGLNIFPTHSLVKNIGFDGTGTNGGEIIQNKTELLNEKIPHSKTENLDLLFFDKFINHFKSNHLSLSARLLSIIKKFKF